MALSWWSSMLAPCRGGARCRRPMGGARGRWVEHEAGGWSSRPPVGRARGRRLWGGGWWRVDNTPLGTPRGRYDEHNSKSSLNCETKVYRTSRRKPNFWRWCLLASRQLWTIYKAPRPRLCFAPAATWNLHTTQPRTLPQLTMRLSISPVCCKQRIKRIEW
jgi:hypothetical protein